MSQSIQPGFNSLISKFTVDGDNLVSNFLEGYAKKIVKGFASSKLASTALSSTLLAEIEIPIAAISALLQEAAEFFQNAPKKFYENGEVALYFNGYWPVTPAEQASMAMEQVDESFEPLQQVARYDICLVKRRLEDGRYEIYDLASKDTKTVSYDKLRPEKNQEVSQYDIIKKLRNQLDFFTPKVNTKTFLIGEYVYARELEGQTDFEGVIKNVSTDVISITVRGEPGLRYVKKNMWPQLLSKSELGNLQSFQQGRSDLQVHSICLYQDGPNLRPCMIIQLVPVCLIRPFHERDAFEMDPRLLTKASTTYITKLYKTPEYRKFIDMVKVTPGDFTNRIPLVTRGNAEGVFEDTRRLKKEAVTYFTESEIIPGSIETRQYGGAGELESPPLGEASAPEMVRTKGGFSIPPGLSMAESEVPTMVKTKTVTIEGGYGPAVIGAAVIIAGILYFK